MYTSSLLTFLLSNYIFACHFTNFAMHFKWATLSVCINSKAVIWIKAPLLTYCIYIIHKQAVGSLAITKVFQVAVQTMIVSYLRSSWLSNGTYEKLFQQLYRVRSFFPAYIRRVYVYICKTNTLERVRSVGRLMVERKTIHLVRASVHWWPHWV